MTVEESRTMVRGLGVVAALLGFMAIFGGSPYSAQHARVDVDLLAKSVQREDDHVTAIELAGWIKNRRPQLRVVDVRSNDEYEAYHLPMAERVPIDSLSSVKFGRDETIVLYSDGGAHAAQAWVFLRALGHDKVYFLRGGVYEWLDQVMSPALATGASAKDSVAFADVAALSRYFGGEVRSPDAPPVRTRRRGC